MRTYACGMEHVIIDLGGGITLERLADGQLVLRHQAMSEPFKLDAGALRRIALHKRQVFRPID